MKFYALIFTFILSLISISAMANDSTKDPLISTFIISNLEIQDLDKGYLGNVDFKKNDCKTGGFSYFNPLYDNPDILTTNASATLDGDTINILVNSQTSKTEFSISNINVSKDGSNAKIDIIKNGITFKSEILGRNLTKQFLIDTFSTFNNSNLFEYEDCPPCVVIGIIAVVVICDEAQGKCSPCDGTLVVEACGCSCTPK